MMASTFEIEAWGKRERVNRVEERGRQRPNANTHLPPTHPRSRLSTKRGYNSHFMARPRGRGQHVSTGEESRRCRYSVFPLWNCTICPWPTIGPMQTNPFPLRSVARWLGWICFSTASSLSSPSSHTPLPLKASPPSFPLKLSCSGRKNDLSPLDRTYAYSVFHPRCEPAWVDDG